ncbi:MAG: peptidylprolyl isomerase [Acidobacteriaceae bacterium]|nr:peptidylprolyl isomerase [Acidobacteriaceae bacterium]
MKSSVLLLALAVCATAASAQTTSTAAQSPAAPAGSSSPATSSASSSGLRLRGPEAVAKEQPNKVVATINGKSITAKEAADIISSLPPEDRKRYESNLPQLVQQLYMEGQIAADAVKQNLDQKPPYKQELQISRDNILTKAYLSNLVSNASAADQAKQYYDAHTAEFDQVKVSGIVVGFSPPGTPAGSAVTQRTESDAQAKANDLEKKLKAGGDFSALARTDSDQQQSATKGGDMGSFVMADTNIPPDIKGAVAKLQSGQISEPVRVNGGYIILKLDSRTRLPFDQVKPSLIQKMELDKYKIHVDDPEFFSSAAPAPTNIPSLAAPRPGTGSASSSSSSSTKPPAK